MILNMDEWQFDIDLKSTMEYSSKEAEDHCDCAYCRNFYAAVDAEYPDMRPFLVQFGLDIEAPDEMMPYDVHNKMYYTGVYMVSGRILRIGQKPILVGNVEIQPTGESGGLSINHGCPAPCFALNVSTIVLPWVLDEPMNVTASPANLPAFLEKMWQKLMTRDQSGTIQS